MKIFVLGSNGSTGRRYKTILKMLGADIEEYDIQHLRNNRKFPSGETAIVATPTHLHYHHVKSLLLLGYKRILVEKPVSKNVDEIENLLSIKGDATISVVCNWAFASFSKLHPGEHKISYNFFNHGTDNEPMWDLCQLLYLHGGLDLDFSLSSPFFNVTVDGFNISLNDIEKSYYRMLTAWIAGPKRLWDLRDGLVMSQKVIKYLDP